MKSLPLRPTVSGSSAGGGAVSAALFGSGTGLRAGDWTCAAASWGVASAAAPANVAPFRNCRRFSFGTSFLDIALPPSFCPGREAGFSHDRKLKGRSIRPRLRSVQPHFAGHERHSARPRPMIQSRSSAERNFISSVNIVTACR